MLKYGFDYFDKIILERCIYCPLFLTLREDYWMDYYDSINNGYNIRKAGTHGKMSPETKRLISESQIGKIISEKQCRLISQRKLGHIVSDSTRRKIAKNSKKWEICFPNSDFTIGDICKKYPRIPYITIAVRIRTAKRNGELILRTEKRKSTRKSRWVYHISNVNKGIICTNQE